MDTYHVHRLLTYLANSAWMLLCRGASGHFFRQTRHVRTAQEKVLLSIVRRNEDTDFGKKYNFHAISSIEDFRRQVPLSLYDDYRPAIDRIARGEENVLTAEPVRLFELSSGSTAPSKLIPCTAGLRREFQRAIRVWIHDLYSNDKELLRGRSYWSITPLTGGTRRSAGGIPIGFADDREYFGRVERFLLSLLFPVPAEVRLIDDIDAFRYVTLLFLLREKNLSLISVWNPSFLSLLLEHLPAWAGSLAVDLGTGAINPPGCVLAGEIRKPLMKRLGNHPRRADEITRIIHEHGALPGLCEKLWPGLRLISTWTSAQAAAQLPRLRELFPGITIQGKGLLATEGFVSFPLVGYTGSALALASHFLEFIEQGNPAGEEPLEVRTADELESGKIYSVVITTGGGLYRYRLLDLVQVVGFLERCPLVAFLGKEENVSDRFGEKVNEYHVDAVLRGVFADHRLAPSFFLVAPEVDEAGRCFYTLYLQPREGDCEGTGDVFSRLAVRLDERLSENFHYAWCRKLGQLSPFRVFLIEDGKGNETYLRVRGREGTRIGSVKPAVLHRGTGWSREFCGRFVSL